MNNRTPVKISTGSGKLEHFLSVNTSSLENSFCQIMGLKGDSVCSKCYSDRYAKMRPNLEKVLTTNSDTLSTRLLKDDEIPFFNARYVRFNSFGELINDIHYQNLLLIADKNPHTIFGLWTKRAKTVMKHKKRKNIKYIYSIREINSSKVSEKISNYFDKIFAVKSKDGPEINCKGKCINCLLCYTDNDTKFIYEKLK